MSKFVEEAKTELVKKLEEKQKLVNQKIKNIKRAKKLKCAKQ